MSGRLSYRQWEADDGTTRSKPEVIAHQVDFLAKPANGNHAVSVPAYDLDEPF